MYRKIELENGIRVVGEYLPYKNIFSVGYWLNSGSRDEGISTSGYSHFIEHMLFKGTEKRSYYDIALAIDKIGAQINASTNREATSYYVNSRYNHLELSIEILSDMLLNSKFSTKEVGKEKMVILEEIKMYNDNPDDHILDTLIETIFGESQLGKPILGSVDNIYSTKRNNLIQYYEKRYVPSKMVISIAGKFDFDNFVKLLKKNKIHKLNRDWVEDCDKNVSEFNSAQKMIERKLKQVHYCIGFPAISKDHKLRYALYLLNAIIGGGMSSKLFQEVREKKGYAYSIYSFTELYNDSGTYIIYCGTDPGNFKKSLDLIFKILKDLKTNCIKNNELKQAKEQLLGLLSLSNDYVEYRMTKLAKQELIFGRHFSNKDVIEYINKVTLSDIKHLIDIIFTKYSMVSIGPSEHLNNDIKNISI